MDELLSIKSNIDGYANFLWVFLKSATTHVNKRNENWF
jgi:hypothetical protein